MHFISKSHTDSKKCKDYSDLFNSEVGKTHTLSRLTDIQSFSGYKVIANGAIPHTQFVLKHGVGSLILSMDNPSNGKFSFLPDSYNKSQLSSSTFLFESSSARSECFEVEVRKEGVRRMCSSDKKHHLQLYLEISKRVVIDTSNKQMRETWRINVVGATKR